MIKNIKKILLIMCLASLGITILMLMSAVFKAPIFENNVLSSILLTFVLICVDSFFNLTSIAVINRTKVLSISAIALLNFASILGLIMIWVGIAADKDINEVFGKFSLIVAISACFFTLIISANAKLLNRFVAIKFIYISLIVIIDVIIILALISQKVNLFTWKNWAYVFIPICLAAFALMCTCSILGRKVKDDIEEKYKKITFEEYNALIDKINELEEENSQLKQQLSSK